MPILTLTRSAGVSRMVRAVNGSSSALPARPRLTSSTPPRWAAIAGQVVLGLSATEPWLIELPWCSQTGRSLVAGRTGAFVRSSTRCVVSLQGSHSSTSFSRPGSPTNRTVPLGPRRVSAPPEKSSTTSSPPVMLICAASSPSTQRS